MTPTGRRSNYRSSPAVQLAKVVVAMLWAGGTARRRAMGRRPPRVIILAYHRIVENLAAARAANPLPQLTAASTFEWQLRWIASRYDVISLDRALEVLAGGSGLRREAAVITIDDGYRETFEIAAPILRALGLPATVFLPTGVIGTTRPIVDDALYVLLRDGLAVGGLVRDATREAGLELEELDRQARPEHAAFLAYRLLNRLPHSDVLRLRDALARRLPASEKTLATLSLMTWAMVRELHRAGWTIGSHGRTHRRLTNETAEVAWNEICGSKADLEAELKAPVRHFAYPDGRYAAPIEAAVRRAGYASGAATHPGVNERGCNVYALGRTIFWEHTSELWPGRHSRTMTLAQAAGLFIRLRRQLGSRSVLV